MISGIILASGFSKRIAENKLLLPVCGIPLVERVIRAAKASRLDEVILVYRQEEVRRIGEDCQALTVFNDEAREGQSAAVKRGIECTHPETGAFMFLVGDQPFLTFQILDTLIATWEEHPDHIIVPCYGGKRGNPVIFPVHLKKELLSLSGDIGGRSVIERNGRVKQVEIRDPRSGFDIDTKEDYETIQQD